MGFVTRPRPAVRGALYHDYRERLPLRGQRSARDHLPRRHVRDVVLAHLGDFMCYGGVVRVLACFASALVSAIFVYRD